MSNLHPGLVLIATGIIAAIVPKSLRKYVLAGGPLVALAAMFSLSLRGGMGCAVPQWH